MLTDRMELAVVFAQSEFDDYARLSGDTNPIHVDRVFASGTRFGRTVAHGMHLFAALQAAIARKTGGPIRLRSQEFVFSAPTVTGDALVVVLDPKKDGAVREEITDSSGTVTTTGLAGLGEPDQQYPPPATLTVSPSYKGLEVGMSASRSRRFTQRDVADFVRLVHDPNPLFGGDSPELPPGLITGMDSWVLGVDLPGGGTNWLKQRYVFHRSVTVPAEITSTVTITGIRPEKGLVNLTTRCTTPDGTLTSGEALVLAVDV